MRPSLLAVLFSLLTLSSFLTVHASATLVPANHPAINYEGRIATDPSGGVQMGFPGVITRLRFRGNAISVSAEASSDTVYFDLKVDRAAPILLRLRKGEAEYSLLRDGSLAEHTIELIRRTESWQGVCRFRAFTLEGEGSILAAPAPPLRRLMFIGDSVTCGSMTAWEPGREHADPINSNACASYGMMLAQKFGAQCHLVSCGGRGLIRDWQGIRDLRAAPQFYDVAIPDDLTTPWDPQRYVPDAIGIQLGTNDFSSGIPDEVEFIRAYVEFVQKVRRDAPSAFIFLMESPILNDEARGPRRSVLRAYLEQIVKRMGSDRVILAPVKHAPGVPGDGHPSRQEHESMAAELEPVLHRALGW